MNMIKLGLITIFLINVRGIMAQGATSQNCRQLENIVQRVCGETEHHELTKIQGPPTKKGEKGAIEPVGPRGPAAVVDYERINEEVQRKVTEHVGAMAGQLRDLNEKVEKLYSIATADYCDVKYNGKCFHAILHSTKDVKYDQGKLLCERLGWKLANIYNLEHYQSIEKHMRPKIAAGNTVVTAWLGMTYVAEKQVLLTSGIKIDLRGLKWYPSFPQANLAYTKTGIYFQSSAHHDHQGIYNYPATANRHGALCEI